MKVLKRVLLVALLGPLILVAVRQVCLAIWKVFDPWSRVMQLPEHGEATGILFNEQYGMVFGRRRPVEKMLSPGFHVWNNDMTRYSKSFIYVTIGAGSPWRESYGADGTITRASYNRGSNTVYALQEQVPANGEPIATLLVSSDAGTTWAEEALPDSSIWGFDFSCAKHKYLWSSTSVYSLPEGYALTQAIEIPVGPYTIWHKPTTDDECNLWTSNDNVLVKVGVDSRLCSEIVLPQLIIDAVKFNPTDSMIWIVGRNIATSKTVVLKRKERNVYEQVVAFPAFLASDVLIEGEVVAIPGTNTEHVVSFLGLKKVLYISKDSGKHWQTDKYFPFFAEEPFFLHQGTMYVNDLQQISKRKL